MQNTKKIFNTSRRIITILVLLMLWPSVCGAHVNGMSIEQTVGDYLVDIGYNPEVLFKDTLARFDFAILNKETLVEQKFTDIWVRIEFGERTVFAGGLTKARFGPTGLSYAFSDAGIYTVFARYSNATSTLAETRFDLTVYEILEEPAFDWVFWSKVIGTSIMGTIIVILFYFLSQALLTKRQSKAANK